MSNTQGDKPISRLWPDALSDAQQLDNLLAVFKNVLQQEHLDEHLLPLFSSLYLPMADWLARQHQGTPLIMGINGGQGSGKSTLCKILSALLETGFGKRVLVISIDDLYLSRADRLQLSHQVHPLLVTRGVPGTHDLPLALDVIRRLKQASGFPLNIPVFDKGMDDRADPSRWQQLDQPVDIVLFEGWCVGAIAQASDDLITPINSLESDEDSDLIWRRYVNQQLAGPYQELFAMLDILVMLKVPAMDNVFEWRLLQENKLKQSLAHNPNAATHVMSEQQLNRFIMHYERITRVSLQEMPARADVVLHLNDQHQVCQVSIHGE